MIDCKATPYSMFDTLKVRNNEYHGMYRGTVLDNDDPMHRGRCKVYVYGVYDEKFKEDGGRRLPWAEPSQPMFCGGYGRNGSFQCPDLNATVWVFFDSGDISRPVMFGQTTDKQSSSVDKTYQSDSPLFTPSSCTFYWEGMYIEMYKPTHTVTVSSENISAIASHDLSGYAGNDAYLHALHNIKMHAGDNVFIEAGSNIVLDAGTDIISHAGNHIRETATDGTTRTAPMNTVDGDEHITRRLTVDSTVTVNSTATVNADATIAGRSFMGHRHGTDHGATTPPI